MNEEELVRKRFEESIARFEADPSKADDYKYQGWKGADFAPIAKKAAEIDEEDLFVRVYRGIKEDGHTPEFWHLVYDLGVDKDGDDPEVWIYNVSNPCPPFCGPGWP